MGELEPPSLWSPVWRVEFGSCTFTDCGALLHIGRMGRFSTVFLLLLAACGDNFDDDGLDPSYPEPIDELVTNGTDSSSSAPRLLPQVCGSQTWTTKLTDDAVNVSVAMRGEASVVLAAPRTGGALAGFVVDPATHTVTTHDIAINGSFSSVATTVIANRVAATSVADSTILLHTLDDDLTNPQYVTKVLGRHLAEPALFAAQADELVMPVGADDGVWLYRFADSFEPMNGTRLIETDPVVALTAAVSSSNMLTAWSTNDSCYMMATNMFSAGTTAKMDGACSSPRLAVNPKGQGVVVFETDAGANVMTLSPSQFGGNARMLRPGTQAPRTVFDGTHFWISFLDERGDIVVGLVDAAGRLTMMGLGAPRPAAGAYELVIGDGSPWVVSLAGGEFSAYRMCALPAR